MRNWKGPSGPERKESRQRVLAIPASKRYMHIVGHATFEVIDAAAVEERSG
jgi:hypothetical protein